MLTQTGKVSAIPGYRVLGPIGSGAAATMFLAEDTDGGRVALKYIPYGSREQNRALNGLRCEQRALSRLDHPGVPKFRHLHRLPGAVCLVRDYCPGMSLRRFMRESPGQVCRLMPDLLEMSGGILQHMHDRGVIHRDFKPENLVVDGQGSVFLVDMALAWRKRRLASKPPLAGTPAYLSPELLGGSSPSFASDAYSLAVTAYELLAGRLPYEGRSREETLSAVRKGGATPPSTRNSTVRAEVDRIVMSGLAADPRDRPRDLRVFGSKLARALRSGALGPAPR